ncbi:hypothetical protein RFI_36752, partial [Reticulomyxa filosa]
PLFSKKKKEIELKRMAFNTTGMIKAIGKKSLFHTRGEQFTGKTFQKKPTSYWVSIERMYNSWKHKNFDVFLEYTKIVFPLLFIGVEKLSKDFFFDNIKKKTWFRILYAFLQNPRSHYCLLIFWAVFIFLKLLK